MSWTIRLHSVVEAWYLELCEDDPVTAGGIEDALDLLVIEGPTVGRPLVDRVKGSRYQNMKELRPPSAGPSEIRMLFAFDPAREAIVLVAGDKSGRWESWYQTAIPLADERFAEHLIALKEEG
ncbi:type II toxin-antitoxin system RelE/ParE family toxin [Kribbella sp. NBC_01505]|uniref:type II toxin-antitoxin system RelE/ParE family toxin n=1 Tax=Kribbella sp. NBC_01505 TaxID=2903580 RepID=UPI00386A88EA